MYIFQSAINDNDVGDRCPTKMLVTCYWSWWQIKPLASRKFPDHNVTNIAVVAEFIKRLKNIPTPEPFIGKSPRLLLITELGPRWNLRSLFNLSLLRFNHCLIFIAIYKQKLAAVESSKQFSSLLNLPKLKLVGLVHLSQQVLLKNISTKDIWHNLWLITNLIPKKCVNPENTLSGFHAFWKFFGELSLRSTFVFESQGIIPGFSIWFCTVTRCQTTNIIWIENPQNI